MSQSQSQTQPQSQPQTQPQSQAQTPEIQISDQFDAQKPSHHIPKVIKYFPQFLEKNLYPKFLNRETIPWTCGKIKLYGKVYNEKRLTCGMSNTGGQYYYSGRLLETYPFDTLVDEIRKLILQEFADLFPDPQKQLNYCLLNHYRDGNDSIGYHADDESTILPFIASISIGAERTFVLKRKEDGKNVFKEDLKDGSLVLMLENCQKEYKHTVPVRKKVKEGRINLTFRVLMTSKSTK